MDQIGLGEHAPPISILGVTAAVRPGARAVQAEGRSRDGRCGNHEHFVSAAAPLGDADENVAVLSVPVAVAVEVEAPASVVVRIAFPADRDGVRITTREGDAQSDADFSVDEKVVTLGAGYVLDGQPHSFQLCSDGGTSGLVLRLAIHADRGNPVRRRLPPVYLRGEPVQFCIAPARGCGNGFLYNPVDSREIRGAVKSR